MSGDWDRIAVVGAPGAGKSWLAGRLAKELGSEHIELDALHFEPGGESDWSLREPAEVRASVAHAVAADRWVACGNWSPVRDLVWGRASAVVWPDYSLATCFGRLFNRTVRRCWSGERVCNGNRERFRTQFASRDSLLLYLIQVHGKRRRNLESAIDDPRWRHLRIERLPTPRATEAWLRAEFAITPR